MSPASRLPRASAPTSRRFFVWHTSAFLCKIRPVNVPNCLTVSYCTTTYSRLEARVVDESARSCRLSGSNPVSPTKVPAGKRLKAIGPGPPPSGCGRAGGSGCSGGIAPFQPPGGGGAGKVLLPLSPTQS